MSAPPLHKEANTAVEEADTARQASDLAALRRMLVASSGTFSLSFALCQDPALRSSLIQRLTAEFPGILILKLPPKVPNVCAHVRAQLPEPAPEAIFILDLESSIPFEGDVQPTLSVLNSTREQWEHFHCPIVFWLAEYGFTRLAQYAPDFWRYRSHQFEFIPEARTLDQARQESFPGHDNIDKLPHVEKLFRLSELEQRLAEVGDPPNADILPHALDWISELSTLLRHEGRFSESENQLRKALHWANDGHGEDSQTTAAVLSNLASLLQAMNRIEEAEPLMKRVLEIDEAHCGPDHPNVAIDLNNLANLFQTKKRLIEAEPLIRRALHIDEASYGPEHPSVAIGLNNLAQLLHASNRLAEAESIMRRAVNIFEKNYGSDHPWVGSALGNLAALLQATNRLEEAEPLMRRALKITEASYGPDHPQVAIRLNNLASLYQDFGRFDEAETLSRRHLGIFLLFQKKAGHEHPHFRAAVANYVRLLEKMGLSEQEILQRLKDTGVDVGEYVSPNA